MSTAVIRLILLSVISVSATDATACRVILPRCQCELESGSVITVRCDQNISVVDSNRLLHEVDSLLSADHIIERLTSLTITDTPLTQVPTSVCQLLNLTSLNLDRNRLTALPTDCFAKLKYLTRFSAADNAIVGLQDGLFGDLQRLESISLPRNNIATIGLGVFSNSSDLTSLRSLNLNNNRLTSLEPWWYYRCILGTEASIVKIQLMHNQISRFTNRLKTNFSCAAKRPFGLLDLSYNSIEHITDMLHGWIIDFMSFACLRNFDRGHTLMKFAVQGRSFACDCTDFHLYAWHRIYPMDDLLNGGVRCNSLKYSSPSLQRPFVTRIPLIEFDCELTERCPPSCRCAYRPANATLHVYCSATNLSSLPLHLPTLPKSYARYKLDFSNNKLLRLENRSYFVDTATLDVSNCAIEHVDLNVWRQFRRMQSPFITPQISLQQNHLRSIPFDVTAIDFASVSFSLNDNPWECSCNHSWMISWLNNLSFVSAGGEDILCASPSTLERRIIRFSNENEFCSELPTETWKIIIPSALSALVLLAAGSAVYCLRVRVYRKFKLHPFDRDECTGEDMDYDVFLCCSSEDHDPHGLHVLELLESKGYRVCYHLRDFLAGLAISDNMCHAATSSKRTVCLISKNFLRSPYCMTEFDMAFHHNVAVKRTKRLIVLMMLDSPNDLDADSHDKATLRHHVRQYTYIDYTADDWLDKLLYALPVRGLLHRDQENGDDVQLLVDSPTIEMETRSEDVFLINGT